MSGSRRVTLAGTTLFQCERHHALSDYAPSDSDKTSDGGARPDAYELSTTNVPSSMPASGTRSHRSSRNLGTLTAQTIAPLRLSARARRSSSFSATEGLGGSSVICGLMSAEEDMVPRGEMGKGRRGR